MAPHRLYISKHLKDLADELLTIGGTGPKETRAQKLAKILWKMALGYTETVDKKEKVHRPSQCAIACILERLEGRVGSVDDGKDLGQSIVDRIHELTKNRLNELADAAVRGSDSDTEGAVSGYQSDLDGPNDGDESPQTRRR